MSIGRGQAAPSFYTSAKGSYNYPGGLFRRDCRLRVKGGAMRTPAQIGRHPVHPMLIVFPIGLLVFSLVCDLVHWAGGSATWAWAAWYTMGGGIIGGLLAAVPGFTDLLSLPESRAKRVAVLHMAINLIVILIFVLNFALRAGLGDLSAVRLILSIIGVGGLIASGWLGGELVYIHGIAVHGPATASQRPEDLGRRAA